MSARWACSTAFLGGSTFSFTRNGASFMDEETGSIWNLLGQAVEGELRGRTAHTRSPRQHALVRVGRLQAGHPYL